MKKAMITIYKSENGAINASIDGMEKYNDIFNALIDTMGAVFKMSVSSETKEDKENCAQLLVDTTKKVLELKIKEE